MKKMKKVLVLVLAMAMVLGMAVTTFAAVTKPTEADTKDVTVSNVESGATVTAYQIIDAVYDDYGFNHYAWAEGTKKAGEVEFVSEGVVKGLTSEFITALAKDVSGLTNSKQAIVAAGATSATLNLEAGTWMILVTPPAENAAKVYNPMVASVYYTVSGSDNSMGGGSVDANANWTLETTGAYAKSTEIALTKNVDDSEAEVKNDIVNFTVNTTIPSYSAEYVNPKFEIKDEIKNGLAYTDSKPVVKVNNVVVTEGTDYSYTPGESSFTITFNSDYVQGLAGKTAEERAVVVTYSATLTETAIETSAENTATVTYNKDPNATGSKEDTEYVHTFAIDGILKKVKEDKDTALAGAEFTLYRKCDNDKLSDAFGIYKTLEDGLIQFKGLDSDRTYYLKETKAPDGYTINEKVYKVEFKNIQKDSAGKVTSYDVIVDGEKTKTIIYGKPAADILDVVVNTKLSSLPSTGGIGIAIFTIGGCVIMIAAAGLFFASRRKEEK